MSQAVLEVPQPAQPATPVVPEPSVVPDPEPVTPPGPPGGPAVMIGDSTWDCRAAANAGVETIAVLTGGFSEQELRDAGALDVFDSIDELRQRLSHTPLG